MMNAMPFRRAGTAIIRCTEIIARYAKPDRWLVRAVACCEPGRAGRDIEGGPMAEKTPDGASGSSTISTRLWVASGTPDQFTGGEMSAPSQVNSDGIAPPSEKPGWRAAEA